MKTLLLIGALIDLVVYTPIKLIMLNWHISVPTAVAIALYFNR